jgi:hypothetical protein
MFDGSPEAPPPRAVDLLTAYLRHEQLHQRARPVVRGREPAVLVSHSTIASITSSRVHFGSIAPGWQSLQYR